MSKSATYKCLGAILLLAFCLRVWGLDFGLPNISRPDEQNISEIVVMNLLQSILHGQPDGNPHFFEYPSLHLYLLAFAYWIYYLIGHLLGRFPEPDIFLYHYQDTFYTFHVISRAITVLFGVLTVWTVYHLGRALSGRAGVGLVASFLLAVTYLHVRDSHFGVTDVPATFWVSLSLWLAVRSVRNRDKKSLCWASLAAGLAASTKYPAGLVGLAVYLAAWLQLPKPEGEKLGFPSLKRMGQEFGTVSAWMFGAFFLTSPFILLNFGEFWHGFSIQREHLQDGHYLDLGIGWIYHFTYTLWNGLGPLYLLAALCGMAVALWQSFRSKLPEARLHWLPLIFVVVYYLLIGNTKTVFLRYIIPIIPVCALYAGWGIVKGADWLHGTVLRTIPKAVVTLILVSIVCAVSLERSFHFDRIVGQPDTRTLTRNWLLSHLNYVESVGIGMPLIHIDLPQRYRRFYLTIPEAPSSFGVEYRPFMDQERTEINLKPTFHGEYQITSYRDADLLRRLGIHYLIVTKTPLTLFTIPDFELQPVMHQYRLVAHFSPMPPGIQMPPKETFDQLDAFYVPFTALKETVRSGPEIFIYEVPPPAEAKR